MQATAVVLAALLLAAGRCAAEEADTPDDLMEEPWPGSGSGSGSGSGAGPAEAAPGAELVKQSRLGAKASPRSRFPASMVGYSRFYPDYSPEYYYPPSYPRYYPSYPNNNYNPPVNYPAANYPTNNYYPTAYPPYYPYDYFPYGSGVNEYSARHERA